MDKELLKNLIHLNYQGSGSPQIDSRSSVDSDLIQEVKDPRKDVVNALTGTHRTMKKAKRGMKPGQPNRKKQAEIFYRAKRVLDKRGYEEDNDDIKADTRSVKKAMRKFMGADSWGKGSAVRGSRPSFAKGSRKVGTRKERRSTNRDLKSRYEAEVEERMKVDPQDTSSRITKDAAGKPRFQHRWVGGKRVRKMTSKNNLHDVSLKHGAKKKSRQAAQQFRTSAVKGVIESLLEAGYPIRKL